MQIDSEFFDEEKGDAETLAGFILELKGDFPAKGESVCYKQFLFTIEASDRRRILKIKLTINHDDIENET
jgi:CBS domain containing-hemolysin-like protein